jgi:hypothetical protein
MATSTSSASTFFLTDSELKRHLRAQFDGCMGKSLETSRYRTVGDDRVSPIVERDQLGQKLRAGPTAVTCDPVNVQHHL